MNQVKFKTGTKLGDVLAFLPHGVINKTETGIGATTLEAICPRNSIIVEPTKAIVADKSRIHECLGVMGGFSAKEIEEYLTDNKDKFKKIFVVSDSVGRLISILKDLGEDVYNQYHYLIDEGEQYQTEAGYRVGMGVAIDYYWEFPPQSRTFQSAFLYRFSNPRLSLEPKVIYGYEEPIRRKVSLLITNNSILETIEVLQKLEGLNLIFCNSIEAINNIIELGGFPAEECAVYCGEDSVEKVKIYHQPFTNKPFHKYSFYTAAYFSGLDIIGDYNVISVIDATKIHTLLSPSKLKQIVGRVRENVLNDIIISSYTPNLAQHYTDYVQARLDDANRAIEIAKICEVIENNKWFNNIKAGIIKTDFDGVLITREDKDGNLVPNYEVIDSKYIHLKTGTDLYSTPTGLKDYLEQEGHKVSLICKSHSFSQEQIQQLNSYREKVLQDKLEATQRIYNLIKNEELKGELDFTRIDLRQLMHETTGITRKLLAFYLDFKDAEALLKSCGDDSFINKYKGSHSFQKLDNNHIFKKKISSAFKANSKFTSQEIGKSINEISKSVGITNQTLKDVQALKILKRFIRVKRCKIVIGMESRIDGYEVIGMVA